MATTSTPRDRSALAFVAAATMVLALAGTADASPVGRAPTVIRGIASYYSSPHWSPKTTRVSTGTTIEWRAVSGVHYIVAYGGHWTYHHSLPTGASVTRRFRSAGTFLFRCRLHSSIVNGSCQGMCGKIVVS
jgi:plastocyanin